MCACRAADPARRRRRAGRPRSRISAIDAVVTPSWVRRICAARSDSPTSLGATTTRGPGADTQTRRRAAAARSRRQADPGPARVPAGTLASGRRSLVDAQRQVPGPRRQRAPPRQVCRPARARGLRGRAPRRAWRWRQTRRMWRRDRRQEAATCRPVRPAALFACAANNRTYLCRPR